MRYCSCRLSPSISLFSNAMNRHAAILQAMQHAANAMYVQNVANVLHKQSGCHACLHDQSTLTCINSWEFENGKLACSDTE